MRPAADIARQLMRWANDLIETAIRPASGVGHQMLRRGSSIVHRLHFRLHVRWPTVFDDPDIKQLLAIHREQDPEGNAETRPPEDVHIKLVSTFLVEVYPPSAADQLITSIKRLGWDNDPDGIHESLAGWITDARQRLGGSAWINLGEIREPGQPGSTGGLTRRAPLPAQAKTATAYIHLLTSALTCLVVQFIWNPSTSSVLEETLRRDRETLMPKRGRGYATKDPYFRKRDEIAAARSELWAVGGNWIKQHLPGAFSAGALNGAFPTADFLMFDGVVPFMAKREERLRWLELLDAEFDWEVWETSELAGLRLSTDTGRNRPYALMLAGALKEVSSADWATGPGRFLEGAPHYLHRILGKLLAAWGVSSLLAGYERQLTRQRDRIPSRPVRRIKGAIARMEVVQEGAFALAADLRIAATDALHLADNARRFADEIPDYKPLNRELWKEDTTWPEVSRRGLLSRAKQLIEREEELRNLLFVEATTHGAIANLKLQRHLARITWLLVILAIGSIAIAAGSLYIALRVPAH